MRISVLKAYARKSLFQLLTLLVAGFVWFAPIALATHQHTITKTGIAAFSTDAASVLNQTANHHDTPLNSNTEERTIEELIEDLTEHQNEVAGFSHISSFLFARSNLSPEGDHYFSPSPSETQPPLYILFHSWKSFLA